MSTYSTPGMRGPSRESVRTTRTSANRENIDTRPCTRAPKPPRSGSSFDVITSTSTALPVRDDRLRPAQDRLERIHVQIPVELRLDEMPRVAGHRAHRLRMGERLRDVLE